MAASPDEAAAELGEAHAYPRFSAGGDSEGRVPDPSRDLALPELEVEPSGAFPVRRSGAANENGRPPAAGHVGRLPRGVRAAEGGRQGLESAVAAQARASRTLGHKAVVVGRVRNES